MDISSSAAENFFMKHLNLSRFVRVALIVLFGTIGGQNFSAPVNPPADSDDEALAKAIKKVQERSYEFGSLCELQTTYRLVELFRQYTYQPRHAPEWKALLKNEQANIYGRYCAAYFLLADDEDARAFIAREIQSPNLRHRYNAVNMLQWFAFSSDRQRGWEWGRDLLIKLINSGALDGSGVTGSPHGEYPDGDRDDIMFSQLDRICIRFGLWQDRQALDAMLGLVERRANINDAIFALGEIGDAKAIPIILKIFKEHAGNDEVITALGKLKSTEAVPLLIAELGSSKNYGDKAIIEALLEIGDRSAVVPLQQYLQRPPRSKESAATARRVLAQFISENPSAELIKLYEQENDSHEQSNILRALAKYPNPQTIAFLSELGSHSDSAFQRRRAMETLLAIKTQSSLLALANLLAVKFPKELAANEGWKIPPENFSVYFPQLIVVLLKEATNLDFGADQSKWTAWIKENIKPR